MSTALFLSILLAVAVLLALWFWYGCRHYEEEIIYLEDIILQVDDTLNGTFLNAEMGTFIRDEAALIREWRQEDSGRD